jgi:hypothetical protein
MKRNQLDRARTICDSIAKYERIADITVSKTCKIVIYVSDEKNGDIEVSLPGDHAVFLRRVVKDHYQGFIDKLTAELEAL